MQWDRHVSAGAWDDLVRAYREAGGEDARDSVLANLLRETVQEVEG